MELATTGNLTTWATDINDAHQKAVGHADRAIDYAKQAGALLLRAKQKLPHGEFGNWLAVNCSVSDRQARRYMDAAQGKPLPVRAVKSDTVSVLPLLPPADDTAALNKAYEQIAVLQYAILMARVRHLPASERLAAYERIDRLETLEIQVGEATVQRDRLMTENTAFKRELAKGRREIDKLKKAA